MLNKIRNWIKGHQSEKEMTSELFLCLFRFFIFSLPFAKQDCKPCNMVHVKSTFSLYRRTLRIIQELENDEQNWSGFSKKIKREVQILKVKSQAQALNVFNNFTTLRLSLPDSCAEQDCTKLNAKQSVVTQQY